MTIWMIFCIWIMTRESSNIKNDWLMRRDHHVSGPFNVRGAQPGDVLEIDIIECVASHFPYIAKTEAVVSCHSSPSHGDTLSLFPTLVP